MKMFFILLSWLLIGLSIELLVGTNFSSDSFLFFHLPVLLSTSLRPFWFQNLFIWPVLLLLLCFCFFFKFLETYKLFPLTPYSDISHDADLFFFIMLGTWWALLVLGNVLEWFLLLSLFLFSLPVVINTIIWILNLLDRSLIWGFSK